MSKTCQHRFPRRACVVAVEAALAALSTVAAPSAFALDTSDPEVAALVQPNRTVEVGVGNLSDSAYKANEYTGLKKSGAFGIGSFDLRGGGAFDSDDATRWRFSGDRLGTEERSLSGEYGRQGVFRLNFGYDELLRLRSDSYQTPLLGAGSNVLTLPSTWLVPLVPRVSSSSPNARGLLPAVTNSPALVSGVLTPPTAAQLATAANIQAADLPAFQSVSLSTKRTKYDVSGLMNLGGAWTLSAGFTHEHKDGLKPMGTVSRATGGDISTIIPDLVDQDTDQVNLGVQYVGEKLMLQAGYYGSNYTNNVPSMTWQNWALPSNSQTMSTAPSNQFHQFSLNGNYAFTRSTRLSFNASYGRSTQNESFLTADITPLVPVASLQGLVVTQSVAARLTSRPTRDLNLLAAYRHEERDNRTPVNIYGFYDAGDAPASTPSAFQSYFPQATLASNVNLNANRPYSRKLDQLDLGGDYRIAKGQTLKAALQQQDIDRYCNGSWIACADASRTRETTGTLEWRIAALENVTAHLSAAHGVRSVDYNEDAWLAIVPAANLSPTGAPNGSTAYGTLQALGVTGYGPISGLNPLPAAGSAAAFFFANNNALSNGLYSNGNRISELPGMRRYNMADRNRDKVRMAVDWQTNEVLSIQAGIDVNNDDYSHSVYGLQQAKSFAMNLEGSLLLNERVTLGGFLTHEEQVSYSAGNSYTANSTATAVNGATAIVGGCFATIGDRNANNKVDPCLNWTARMRDTVDTVGASYQHKGLLNNKLTLDGSASFSYARTASAFTGGNYANNPLAVAGAPAGTVASFFIPATTLPEVVSKILDLKVSGRYELDRQSAVRIGWRYQRMSSNDWMYDGLQPGGLAGVLPTMEKAPAYSVNTVAVSYIYSFR